MALAIQQVVIVDGEADPAQVVGSIKIFLPDGSSFLGTLTTTISQLANANVGINDRLDAIESRLAALEG